MKVKIEVDGIVKFSHDNFDDLINVYGDNLSQEFDLELYTIPAAIRKVLKVTKLREIVEIRCKRKDKLIDHFDENSIFKKEYFENF